MIRILLYYSCCSDYPARIWNKHRNSGCYCEKPLSPADMHCCYGQGLCATSRVAAVFWHHSLYCMLAWHKSVEVNLFAMQQTPTDLCSITAVRTIWSCRWMHLYMLHGHGLCFTPFLHPGWFLWQELILLIPWPTPHPCTALPQANGIIWCPLKLTDVIAISCWMGFLWRSFIRNPVLSKQVTLWFNRLFKSH